MVQKQSRPKGTILGHASHKVMLGRLSGSVPKPVELSQVRFKGLIEIAARGPVHSTPAYNQALELFAKSPAPGHETLLLDFLIAAKRKGTRLINTYLEFHDVTAREAVGKNAHGFLFSPQHPNRLHFGAELLHYLKKLSQEHELGIE